MKKLTALFSTVGVIFLTSCGEGPEPPEPPTPEVDYWRTTHQYFSRSLDDSPLPYPEKLVEAVNMEISTDISEAESYQLRFREDGTGSGSGVRHDGEGRFHFNFTWQLPEAKPEWWIAQASPDAKWLSITEIRGGYGGVFFTYDWIALGNVIWEVEEYTDDKMVLLTHDWLLVDGTVDGVDMPWSETHTYRYTFERVK